MKTNYPICLVISTLGDEGIKYAYNSKIFNKRDLEVMDLITTVMHVLHLSFKGRKLPPISVIPDKCKRGIDGVRHFFVANDTKTVAEWCLCNRDITQPLFEKYGFDVTATVHGSFSELGPRTCRNEKWGLLLSDLFAQCEEISYRVV